MHLEEILKREFWICSEYFSRIRLHCPKYTVLIVLSPWGSAFWGWKIHLELDSWFRPFHRNLLVMLTSKLFNLSGVYYTYISIKSDRCQPQGLSKEKRIWSLWNIRIEYCMRQKNIYFTIITTEAIISQTQKMTCEVSLHRRGRGIYD